LDGLQVSPIQRRRVHFSFMRASGWMRGELGRGKPLSLLFKSQVGSSGELLQSIGVPMAYFNFYEILGKEGGTPLLRGW
jgi:hypothetical protein